MIQVNLVSPKIINPKNSRGYGGENYSESNYMDFRSRSLHNVSHHYTMFHITLNIFGCILINVIEIGYYDVSPKAAFAKHPFICLTSYVYRICLLHILGHYKYISYCSPDTKQHTYLLTTLLKIIICK